MRLIGVVSSVRTGPLSIYTKTTHWRSVVNSSIRVLCVLLLGVVLAACGKKEPPANAKAVKLRKRSARETKRAEQPYWRRSVVMRQRFSSTLFNLSRHCRSRHARLPPGST